MFRKIRTRGLSLTEPRVTTPSLFDLNVSPVLPDKTSEYQRVSTFHSFQLSMQICSPAIKVVPSQYKESVTAPIFGENDQVQGSVTLDPTCTSHGTLGVSLEGTFTYFQGSSFRRHTFCSGSTSFVVHPESPRSSIRDAFEVIRGRPNTVLISSKTGIPDRTYHFAFDLPQSSRAGEELPHSFLASKSDRTGSFEIAYKIVACWYPGDRSESDSSLEAPILVQGEADFQSLDGQNVEPQSWLEMPLKGDPRLPFQCAVNMPNPVTFRRSGPLPYFVVFTTTPRSVGLAKLIALHSRITVSFLRCITISEIPGTPPSPPLTPLSDDSDGTGGSKANKVLRRIQSASRFSSRTEQTASTTGNRQSCAQSGHLLQVVYSDTTTIMKKEFLGFPKRPRVRVDPDNSHPSLEEQMGLPDSLLKDSFNMSASMLPSTDWMGLNIKYYLDISVVYRQDEFRARIPVRLI